VPLHIKEDNRSSECSKSRDEICSSRLTEASGSVDKIREEKDSAIHDREAATQARDNALAERNFVSQERDSHADANDTLCKIAFFFWSREATFVTTLWRATFWKMLMR